MDIFDISSVKNLKVYDSTMFHLEQVEDQYLKYTNELLKLPTIKLARFLDVLKDRNTIENQESENDNSFLISLLEKNRRKNAINEIIKIYNEKGILDSNDIKYLHKIAIAGSADDIPKNYDYRSDPNQWVGTFDEIGNKIIDYELLECDKVIMTMETLLDFLNNDSGTIIDNIFLKPIVFHLLFAILQPFGNGNTRTARLVQHAKIWKTTNEKIGISEENTFKLPILYLSKNYTLTQYQYRKLIKDVAISRDNNSWNKWFEYNLNMIDEQLNFVEQNLQTYSQSCLK